MKTQFNFSSGNFFKNLRFWLLAGLAGIFPAIFHYANNADILLLASLLRMAAAGLLLSVVVYLFMLVLFREPAVAGNAAFVFLVFFNLYGVLYDALLKLDLFQVEHFALLPLVLLVAGYSCWLLSRLKPGQSLQLWSSLTFILGALVVFNLVRIVPAELEKQSGRTAEAPMAVDVEAASQKHPDIYFIILDEFSGFEPMREYWKNPKVEDFLGDLNSRGFFVAQQSRSSSITTLHQMAERLNYEEFPCCENDNRPLYFRNIVDSKVMRYLKEKGYTTVVMEQLTEDVAYKSMPPIIADYTFTNESPASSGAGAVLDEFAIMLADNSMLRAFSKYYQTRSTITERHRQMVFYAMDKVGNLQEVNSPKFVYLHLLFPHKPFMYDENGQAIDLRNRANWNYYLGQYNYSLTLVISMLDGILEDADPGNPPVIILQSDHGARNVKNAASTVILENFSEEYKYSILFALHMPGYDSSQLPQDVKPINTFPIVFNYLFGDNIPLK
jgi:hypothetical protein